ncbi:M48 family metallopeptidase [Candidatus Bathyarchaeota archaeon]|nr:M48 family metallopeptidase [Candidatus Bathyarchaeota archaeon]
MTFRDFREEIARNKRDSLLLTIVVSLILFGLIFSMAYLFAPDALFITIPFSLIITVIYTWSSYQYGDQIVLSSVGARPADAPEYTYLRDSVEGLSIAAGIPPPKTYVIDSADLNAFATGNEPDNASIAVTTGLMKNLNRQELEGVIAHEMSHIKNRDIQFMTLVAVLVGLASILSHIILRNLRWSGSRRGRRGKDRGSGIEIFVLLIGVILAIIAPIVTRLVQLAVSRRREYLADASGAELTRYPEGLASALEKIMKLNTGKMDIDEAVSHLFFADPTHIPLDNLYATHPPIQDRIKRLREM